MRTPFLTSILGLHLILASTATAWATSPRTEWLFRARHGVFVHFLPSGPEGLRQVEQFDVEALARQLAEIGSGYLVLTLGQNSGYFNAPNAAYSQRTGYAPGERCSQRDLPLELYAALHPRGIRLLLYLPCQTPNQDPRAQKAFGLQEGPQDQPINLAFAEAWSQVIQEWSDRYGDKVAGWWFDGGYAHVGFNEAIASRYAAAARHGNPQSLVTFNPGVKVVRWTEAEDYAAGELNEPRGVIPAGRWLNGSQWHALTFLGDMWGRRNVRFEDAFWTDWARQVIARQGVITFDAGPNYDPAAGPIGSLSAPQLAQLKAIGAALRAASNATGPARLRRADSFFGIHFDFHAGTDCTEIGKNTTAEMVDKIIDAAHPDYVQIDCKGHPGLSSYPTAVGNRAPGFVGDPLRIWREATARRGVALYMHYSGVWDSEAIRQHPDWAALNAEGKPGPNANSFFGPYAERLLIPQLRELAREYGVDGAWVDGECWASVPDYGIAALQAFRTATGFEDVPRKPGDPHWFEFLEFNRQAFRTYLRHYLAEVKRTDPALQLCSNWAFSDHMPEAVCAPVDWISGDFTPEDAVNSARLSARYLARQGKPWDLMAWGFTTQGERRNGSNRKSAVQLQREAALVLSQGGGFQFYYNQRRDGSVPEDCLPVITEVAKFCRARQAVSQGAVPVPQIALLYSTASHYREINGLFNRDLSRIAGTLQALLEGQQIVDVVGEHGLLGRMAEYALIVVAECDYLEPSFKQELVRYVENGGQLLLVGPQAAALFEAQLGATLGDAASEPRYLRSKDVLLATRDQSRRVTLGPTATGYGTLHERGATHSPFQPAASVTALGRGRLAATYFSFSRGYLAGRAPGMREYLNGLVRELFPEPVVRVQGTLSVDVAVSRLPGGRLAVHVINTSGAHWDTKRPLIETIEPVGPLGLTVRLPARPRGITLMPAGDTLPFEFENGLVRLTLPQFEIHSIVVIDPTGLQAPR